MKKITLLFLMLFTTTLWQVNAQSTIEITTSGGNFGTEKWVSITDMPDGAGTQVWGQGDGTYGNGQGLLTNEAVTLAPGTYYVNCYDRFADTWDGTLISVTAYGAIIGDNGGTSPDDGTDNDTSSDWETPADELEASFMIVVPSPPACPPPSSLTATNITETGADIGWTLGGSEAAWEYVVQPAGNAAPTGAGTATSANPTSILSLTAGTAYEFYVRANCGSEFSDWSIAFPFTTAFSAPANDECSGAINLTVNTDYACGTVTAATNAGATASAQPDDATGTPNDDVWFTFTASGENHRVSILNKVTVTGTSTDMGMSVFDDAAGCSMVAANEVGESDPDILNLTGLTMGNTYYVRVYGWGSATSAKINFDICIGTPPPSGPGDSCALAITATVVADCSTATPITIDYSTATDLGTTDLSCDTFGTNTGAWLEFTAPASGAVKVSFTDTNEYALFDACGGTEVVCEGAATNQADFSGLTPGTIYKLAVWKDNATTGTTDVCFEEVNCLLPTALSVSVIDATNASIDWTAGASETAWEYVVQDQGTGAPTAAGTVATTNSTNVGSLTEGNDYEFYVRANCGGTFSDWAGPFDWSQVVPPANDAPAGAIDLTLDLGTACGANAITGISNAGSTDSGEATPSCGSYSPSVGNGDMWYKFVAPTSGSLTLNTENVTTTSVAGAYYSGTPGALTEEDCTQFGSGWPWDLSGLTPGTTYYLRVWDFGNDQLGTFDLCGYYQECPAPTALSTLVVDATSTSISWNEGGSETAWEYAVQDQGTGAPTAAGTATTTNPTNVGSLTEGNDYEFYVRANCGGTFSDWAGPFNWSQVVPPANDNCTNAIAVGSLPYNNTMDATAATNTGGFIDVTSCGSMNDGVWYTFTVNVSGTIDVALSGITGWDPEIAVYTGSCGTFTCVDSADNGASGADENLTGLAVTAGTQYWINIGNWSGSTDNAEGPFTLDISSPDTAVLGVDSNTLEGFSLYPNPVKNELFLNAQDNIQEVQVYNLLGRRVMVAKPNLLRTSVSLESLSTGMYIVKVKVNDKVGSYKIIKE